MQYIADQLPQQIRPEKKIVESYIHRKQRVVGESPHIYNKYALIYTDLTKTSVLFIFTIYYIRFCFSIDMYMYIFLKFISVFPYVNIKTKKRVAWFIHKNITTKVWFDTFNLANIVLYGVIIGVDLEFKGLREKNQKHKLNKKGDIFDFECSFIC